jgi:hypothetical protein
MTWWPESFDSLEMPVPQVDYEAHKMQTSGGVGTEIVLRVEE